MLVPVVCLLVLTLILSVATAASRGASTNEAWFADPAFHLATQGFLGATVLETSGTWLEGLHRHTYWILPLYPLAQAAVIRVFGFSLAATRGLSIFWSLIALTAFFVVLRSLAGREVALLGTLLLATDLHFVTGASIGRMDMMCAALGLSGIAAYLILRERWFRAAILLSQTLAAAACLTHPVGILAPAGLALLALWLDRKRWNWRWLALAGLPYAVGLAAYGAYALQDFPSFLRQLSGNVSGLAGEATGSSRFSGILRPWSAFYREIANRYVSAFYGRDWKDPERLQLLVLLVYWGGALVALLDRKIRRQHSARLLLSLAGLYFVILSLFEGLKLHVYLVHTLPWFAGLAALWIWNWTEGQRRARIASITAILAVQFLTIGFGVWKNEYRNEYLPAAAYMQQHGATGSLIMASGQFAYEFGFDGRLVDDVRLGYFSGKQPEFYVRDGWYDDWLKGAKKRDPAVYQHVKTTLAEHYREVFHNTGYKIYQLR